VDRALSQAAGPRPTPPAHPAQVTIGRRQYREALDYLFARTTGKWKLGLERMDALLARIGRPHEQLRAFHVAGTNGKGSVCATLDALLQAKGLKVGLYTSPHLVDFRERFVINGVPITEDDVTDWIARRTRLVERLRATFFEATTAMAFELFARAEVDVAVVEVGLGGRLDATNVLSPLAAGVASIGIDHVEFLGNTREQIAWEKAGIFKAGRPAVIGEADPAIRELLARHAREAGAEPVRVVADEVSLSGVRLEREGGTSFTLRYIGKPGRGVRLCTPLSGVYQAANTALALTMLDAAGEPYAVAPRDAAPALERVSLPGRFQRVGNFLFDVAHNPDGALGLVSTLQAFRPPAPLVALLAVLGDKDWRGIMDQLGTVVDHFVLTSAPSAPASRAWNPHEALAYATARGWSAECEIDFERAMALAESAGRTTLVTGSFHTVGDAMARVTGRAAAILPVAPLAG
jgi:dihydrofolate synthase/folylpolyglutamate synthase